MADVRILAGEILTFKNSLNFPGGVKASGPVAMSGKNHDLWVT